MLMVPVPMVLVQLSAAPSNSFILFLYCDAQSCAEDWEGDNPLLWPAAWCTPGQGWPSWLPEHCWLMFSFPSTRTLRSFSMDAVVILLPSLKIRMTFASFQSTKTSADSRDWSKTLRDASQRHEPALYSWKNSIRPYGLQEIQE